jgi:hypothetical protein
MNFEAADQQRREPHEADDVGNFGLAVQVQQGTGGDDGDHRERAGAACHDGDDGPPVEHRELEANDVFHDVGEGFRLGLKPAEGLYGHHVAQCILCAAGEQGMRFLGLALAGLGLADHEQSDADEDGHKGHQHQRQAPVQERRERQQHDHRDIGGEVFLEEGEAECEQRVRPRDERFHHAARFRVRVE